MDRQEAKNLFIKRNKGLRQNPTANIPERIQRQNIEIERNELAIQALEQADKYKYHDLRKNPDDLPNEHEVLIAYNLFGKTACDKVYYGEPLLPCCEVIGKVFYRSDSEWGDVPVEDVLAWRYIELFESEEN